MRRRAVPAIGLDGAVVAITGGGRGIGLAAARAFAARGARVFIGDIDRETAEMAAAEMAAGDAAGDAIGDVAGERTSDPVGDEAGAATGYIRAIGLDVTSRESFNAFIGEIEQAAGRVDVLVNNAGIMPAGRLLDESDAVSRAVIDINLLGPVFGMKAVLPGMLRRGSGHIVNVASMAGKVHVPGLATYVASKHAVVGLSDAVRDELFGMGVTITTVMPTAVKTQLVAGLPIGGLFAVTPERVADVIVRSVTKRPAEVAVPRWFAGYSLLKALTPRWLMRRGRRALGAWRLMDQIDADRRGDYQARIERDGGTG